MILVIALWIIGCYVAILRCSWVLKGMELLDDKYMGRFIMSSGSEVKYSMSVYGDMNVGNGSLVSEVERKSGENGSRVNEVDIGNGVNGVNGVSEEERGNGSGEEMESESGEEMKNGSGFSGDDIGDESRLSGGAIGGEIGVGRVEMKSPVSEIDNTVSASSERNVESRIAGTDESGIDIMTAMQTNLGHSNDIEDRTNGNIVVVIENQTMDSHLHNQRKIFHNPTPTTPSLFQIHTTHSIFTSRLQPDIAHSPSFNITPVLLMIQHSQQQGNSSAVSQSKRHHFILGGVPHMRAPWLYASDVCYNPATTVYTFYSKSSLQFPKSSFKFGWNFKHASKSPPSDVSWVDEPMAVSQAFTPRHIYHFAESVNQLILILYHPSEYPPIHTLLLPQFKVTSELKWSKEYLHLITSLLPNLTVALAPPTITCYRHLLFLDRLNYLQNGGLLGGFRSADTVRALVYQRFRVSPPATLSALVLHRSGSRAWKSQYQIMQLIRRIAFRFNATVRHSDLVGYDLQKQVILFSQSDVVIATHGAALTNVMFMRPHTAVVECFPPYFYELTFETICGLEQVLYISVPDFPRQALYAEAVKYYRQGSFYQKRRKFIDAAVFPPPSQLYDAVVRAFEFVTRWRGSFRVTDQWSESSSWLFMG